MADLFLFVLCVALCPPDTSWASLVLFVELWLVIVLAFSPSRLWMEYSGASLWLRIRQAFLLYLITLTLYHDDAFLVTCTSPLALLKFSPSLIP